MNSLRATIFRGSTVTLLLAFVAPALQAQATDSTIAPKPSTMDSAFARARALVISGNTVAGRAIVDSILAATPPGTDAYGDALYGRATLAPTATDAARDYRRIVVEYPLSAHAGDALLQLAQLERSQGDRASAVGHLQRYVRENPSSPNRPKAGLWLAQLLFEQNDDLQACRALDTARVGAPSGDVEFQNQINFYTPRCNAAMARAQADSEARADSLRADSVARADSVRKAADRARDRRRREAGRAGSGSTARSTTPASTTGRYSVQLGAFATEAEARKLVDTLRPKGIDARVDGSAKPFRVRVGHYATHAAAAEELTRLKKAGLNGFVTSTGDR
jgi:cell division protein FtsN